jgi:hypothetical protein
MEEGSNKRARIEEFIGERRSADFPVQPRLAGGILNGPGDYIPSEEEKAVWRDKKKNMSKSAWGLLLRTEFSPYERTIVRRYTFKTRSKGQKKRKSKKRKSKKRISRRAVKRNYVRRAGRYYRRNVRAYRRQAFLRRRKPRAVYY